MAKTGIILLSGGLDSLVSLDIAKKENIDIKLALTMNYGQKAFNDEFVASKDICKYYNIKHKIIELPFLKELSDNALTNDSKDNLDSLEGVWIPNRNGLFLNIAGSYCDKLNLNYIIFGANKQEGVDFPDNTKGFVDFCNKTFEFSTLHQVKVFAPCLNFDKIEIVNYAIDNNIPLQLLKSCYAGAEKTGKKHCGKCMSCKLLFNAIKSSKKPELLKEIFNAD